MKTSFHSIKLKQWNLAGCNICNSLHETNVKYENLNSIKSQLHYHHATYYSCSYVVNFIREYFNRFALANLTTSSKFETRKLHTIISQATATSHYYRKTFCSNILAVHFTAGVTNLFETESYFLVQIYAMGYQFDAHTSEIKICSISLQPSYH